MNASDREADLARRIADCVLPLLKDFHPSPAQGDPADGQTELERLQKEVDDLKTTMERSKGERKEETGALRAKIAELIAEKEKLDAEVSGLRDAATKAAGDRGELEEANAALDSSLKAAEKRASSLQTERDEFQRKLNEETEKSKQYALQCQEWDEHCKNQDDELKHAEQKAQESTARATELQGELSTATSEIESLRTQLSTATNEKENLQTQLSTATGKAQGLENELNGKKQELETTKGSLNAAEEKIRALQADLAARQALSDRLWPDFLGIDALKEYADQWKQELLSKNADPTVLCMFANLFAWNCANELSAETGGSDTSLEQVTIPSLHAFSRFLFDWLYAKGVGPERVQDISLALARSVNARLVDSNAAYCIDEAGDVVLGDAFSSTRMQPHPKGAEKGSVLQIHSWCIKSTNGSACLKKAQVLLG